MDLDAPPREITEPVALCLAGGRLNPAAVGFSRTPLHDTSGIRGGRSLRWETWTVTGPRHLVIVSAEARGPLARYRLWVLDRATGAELERHAVCPSSRARIPGSLGDGPTRGRTRRIEIGMDEVPGGTRVRALSDRVQLDVFAARPSGQQSLGTVSAAAATSHPRGGRGSGGTPESVAPESVPPASIAPGPRRGFAYTASDPARPATGTLRVDGIAYTLEPGACWAALDHGRGRSGSEGSAWGGGSGSHGGSRIGLRLGAQSALTVDGRLERLGAAERRATDRVDGPAVALRFTPLAAGPGPRGRPERFGHYDGRVTTESGEVVEICGLLGWRAEPARGAARLAGRLARRGA